MGISERRTPDCSLAELPRGSAGRIVAVDASHAPRLAALGLHPGAVVAIEGDAPLGGPRIVRLGHTRLALARAVARSIRVAPASVATGLVR